MDDVTFTGAAADIWVATSVQKVIEESDKKSKKEKRNKTVGKYCRKCKKCNEKKNCKFEDLKSIKKYYVQRLRIELKKYQPSFVTWPF